MNSFGQGRMIARPQPVGFDVATGDRFLVDIESF
jgi:hypothetical protein